jgi:hypothetical protein
MHLVLHAPQTVFGWVRMQVEPALKLAGALDVVVIDLGFVGPTIFGFHALRKAEAAIPDV